MNETKILGITVTRSEYDRFEQIRSEMLAQGRHLSEAIDWAACAIGMQGEVRRAVACRNEYARLVNVGTC